MQCSGDPYPTAKLAEEIGICEAHKTNRQTESHRMKQDLELHVVVRRYILVLE